MTSNLVALVAGLAGVAMFGYFIYDRYLAIKHKISIDFGNVVFARIISKAKERNEKLALIMVDLKVINAGPKAVTLKDICLNYEFEGKRLESKPYPIPTGIL